MRVGNIKVGIKASKNINNQSGEMPKRKIKNKKNEKGRGKRKAREGIIEDAGLIMNSEP